ncbi:hypothetical protein [Streptomyces cadmiisoli]|uniref:hypothetical protein n=1 Tax=Streptomyces cadmiisoli TaxID=2184053 RepID=UPI00365241B3
MTVPVPHRLKNAPCQLNHERDSLPERCLSDHERAVAQRDVECKKKVDLIRRWNTAESAIQQNLIKKHKAVLDRFLDLQDAKVAATRQLLRTND